jgi:glycine/D-amino acid oxidase-like deaminating enzyme
MDMTRRQAMAALAASGGTATAAAAQRPRRPRQPAKAYDTLVVGAGVFGAWTAEKLRRAGQLVLLIDAVAPAHAKASSGDDSRMTRAAYGGDAIYSRMALDSLADWKALSASSGRTLFHDCGVLFFFPSAQEYAAQTLDVHRRLGLPTVRLQRRQLARRWPQVDWTGVAFGLYEPGFGALAARSAVEATVASFVANGGEYRRAAARLPLMLADGLTLDTGERVRAGHFVFACGPWLPKLFPDVLADRMFITRQAVVYFEPPAGEARFAPERFPGWADFNQGDLYYGFPDLDGRGIKIAHDRHGRLVDPDDNPRIATATEIDDVVTYMRRRFPALAAARVADARVCQYENSASGDFLVDRHPAYPNVVLVGMGSGHGFKHGPAVGALAADLVLRRGVVEPRFSLASKTTRQDRAVH